MHRRFTLFSALIAGAFAAVAALPLVSACQRRTTDSSILAADAQAAAASPPTTAETVKQVGRSFGPSERMTVDFANLDESTLNIVTGESGNIFSPHYMDQWKAWYEGTTYALPFSEQAVEHAANHRLQLIPAK